MSSSDFVFEADASAEPPTVSVVAPVTNRQSASVAGKERTNDALERRPEKCLNGSRVAFKTNGHSADALSVLDLRPSRVVQTSFVAQRNPEEARLRRASWS